MLMSKIKIKAPAKINIGLNIIEKRNDGYHNLKTFFYPIKDLFDGIEIIKSTHFKFTCENNSELNTNNIVLSAITELQNFTNRNFNVEIELTKNIPIGAGLGGGSSDAAAVLVSLNEMFKLKLNLTELTNIAIKIGADVPFFLKAKPAIGKQKGELLENKNLLIEKYILLINPGIHISTKDAYSRITPQDKKLNFSEIEKIDISEYKNLFTNDFEQPIFSLYPEIENIKNEMYKNKALFALMSGSGSSVFGIFNSEEDAQQTIKKLPKNYFSFISDYKNYF